MQNHFPEAGCGCTHTSCTAEAQAAAAQPTRGLAGAVGHPANLAWCVAGADFRNGISVGRGAAPRHCLAAGAPQNAVSAQHKWMHVGAKQ
eukprot:352715-Chlamydomonas_euryale.AAC.8